MERWEVTKDNTSLVRGGEKANREGDEDDSIGQVVSVGW